MNWIRYHEFQRMMYMNNPLQYGSTWDDNYFSNYYSRYLHGKEYHENRNSQIYISKIHIDRNLCRFGCPTNSHCEWGFCECNVGFVKIYVSSCGYLYCIVCLSAQSIVHGEVLSEKINFSAHGSSNSAKFGSDYLDPLGGAKKPKVRNLMGAL